MEGSTTKISSIWGRFEGMKTQQGWELPPPLLSHRCLNPHAPLKVGLYENNLHVGTELPLPSWEANRPKQEAPRKPCASEPGEMGSLRWKRGKTEEEFSLLSWTKKCMAFRKLYSCFLIFSSTPTRGIRQVELCFPCLDCRERKAHQRATSPPVFPLPLLSGNSATQTENSPTFPPRLPRQMRLTWLLQF